MAGVFRKVYSFIRKDFWRKMIALFFALMIYAVVQDLQQDGRTVTDVPVEVVLPPELVSIGAPEFRVTVRAKGPSRGLAQINPNDLRARVRVGSLLCCTDRGGSAWNYGEPGKSGC